MSVTVISGKECLEGAQRGLAWLLEQQKPDGGWKALNNPPVDAYYKAGWMFGLMGEVAAAHRALDYVRQHLLQPNGDFAPRGHIWHVEVHYLYTNGWLTIGAHKLGRYDVSIPAMRFLLSQQDPDQGGFYSLLAKPGEKRRTDTMSSGIAGIACLATGQIEAAKKVASHFEWLVAMQPAPDERFYITAEADYTLGTEFPDDEEFWRVIHTNQENQCWYAVSLPWIFLVMLGQATGEERYARLGQWFLDFQLRCVKPWDSDNSGKAGWAGSMLYRLTGEQRHRDIAAQVASNIISWQTPEGWFDLDGPAAFATETKGAQAKEFTAGDLDVTAEFVVWLKLIGSNLLARDGR